MTVTTTLASSLPTATTVAFPLTTAPTTPTTNLSPPPIAVDSNTATVAATYGCRYCCRYFYNWCFFCCYISVATPIDCQKRKERP